MNHCILLQIVKLCMGGVSVVEGKGSVLATVHNNISIFELSIHSPHGRFSHRASGCFIGLQWGPTEGYAHPHAKWLFKTTYPLVQTSQDYSYYI